MVREQTDDPPSAGKGWSQSQSCRLAPHTGPQPHQPLKALRGFSENPAGSDGKHRSSHAEALSHIRCRPLGVRGEESWAVSFLSSKPPTFPTVTLSVLLCGVSGRDWGWGLKLEEETEIYSCLGQWTIEKRPNEEAERPARMSPGDSQKPWGGLQGQGDLN